MQIPDRVLRLAERAQNEADVDAGRAAAHEAAALLETLPVDVCCAVGPRVLELLLPLGNEEVEGELAGDMLYIVNEDAPGFIGRIGTLLGENGINIGTFHLGRRDAGGEAVLLLSLDAPIPQNVMDAARKLPGVKTVRALAF